MSLLRELHAVRPRKFEEGRRRPRLDVLRPPRLPQRWRCWPPTSSATSESSESFWNAEASDTGATVPPLSSESGSSSSPMIDKEAIKGGVERAAKLLDELLEAVMRDLFVEQARRPTGGLA